MTEIANDKNGGRVVLVQSTKGRSAPFETLGFRYSDLFRISIFGFRYLNPQRFDQLILSRDLRAVPLGLEHRNNRAEQDWLEAPATPVSS